MAFTLPALHQSSRRRNSRGGPMMPQAQALVADATAVDTATTHIYGGMHPVVAAIVPSSPVAVARPRPPAVAPNPSTGRAAAGAVGVRKQQIAATQPLAAAAVTGSSPASPFSASKGASSSPSASQPLRQALTALEAEDWRHEQLHSLGAVEAAQVTRRVRVADQERVVRQVLEAHVYRSGLAEAHAAERLRMSRVEATAREAMETLEERHFELVLDVHGRQFAAVVAAAMKRADAEAAASTLEVRSKRFPHVAARRERLTLMSPRAMAARGGDDDAPAGKGSADAWSPASGPWSPASTQCESSLSSSATFFVVPRAVLQASATADHAALEQRERISRAEIESAWWDAASTLCLVATAAYESNTNQSS
jgi:hypothetical protein